MPANRFNPVYRPRRRGISVFRVGSTAFACSVLFMAIYLVFGEGMSPQQIFNPQRIFNWVQTHVGEKNNALTSAPQPESVPAEPPQAAPAAPAQEQPPEQKPVTEQTSDSDAEQELPTGDGNEIVKPASVSSESAAADAEKRVEKKQKRPTSKSRVYRNQYNPRPRKSTVFVSRTETIFQFAMEKYGNADWATVRKIRAVNPQLRDPYQVLKRGQMIRLPADPPVRD